MLIFEAGFDFRAAHAEGVLCHGLSGVLGTGIAYGLWFAIVARLPAMTASLGVLGSPVIGVVSSVLILGERPTAADIIGFALIFAASACVLFARARPRPAQFARRRLDRTKRATDLTDCANAATRATIALCGSASASMTVK